jgi:hypothetical protein
VVIKNNLLEKRELLLQRRKKHNLSPSQLSQNKRRLPLLNQERIDHPQRVLARKKLPLRRRKNTMHMLQRVTLRKPMLHLRLLLKRESHLKPERSQRRLLSQKSY